MIRKIVFISIFTLILSLCLTAKNYLAVISLDSYKNMISVEGKTASAKEIKDYLYEKYTIDTAYELYDNDATYENIDELLMRLNRELTTGDSLIFLFSGAGGVKDGNKYYWMPHDAGKDETERNNWIEKSDIIRFLNRNGAKKILLFTNSVFPDKEVKYTGSLNNKAVIVSSSGTGNTDKDNNNFKDKIKDFLKSSKNDPFDNPAFAENNNIYKNTLSPMKIGGIITLSAGSLTALTGTVLFIVDRAYVVKMQNEAEDYSSYLNYYNTNKALFGSGIALISTGAVLMTVSIPLLVIKGKEKLSFNIGAGRNTEMYFKFRL